MLLSCVISAKMLCCDVVWCLLLSCCVVLSFILSMVSVGLLQVCILLTDVDHSQMGLAVLIGTTSCRNRCLHHAVNTP